MEQSGIELGSKIFWEQMQDNPALLAATICQVDLVDLQGTLEKHPALVAWVNASFETSRVAEERAKWVLTRARSTALLNARMENDPNTGKPKTVGVLEAEVEDRVPVDSITLDDIRTYYVANFANRGLLLEQVWKDIRDQILIERRNLVYRDLVESSRRSTRTRSSCTRTRWKD